MGWQVQASSKLLRSECRSHGRGLPVTAPIGPPPTGDSLELGEKGFQGEEGQLRGGREAVLP